MGNAKGKQYSECAICTENFDGKPITHANINEMQEKIKKEIGKLDQKDEELFTEAHVCLANTQKEYLNNITIKMISPKFVVTMFSGDGQNSYTIVLKHGKIVVDEQLFEGKVRNQYNEHAICKENFEGKPITHANINEMQEKIKKEIGKLDKQDEELFTNAHVCLANTQKEYLNDIAIKIISPKFVVTMLSGDGQNSYTIVHQHGKLVVHRQLVEGKQQYSEHAICEENFEGKPITHANINEMRENIKKEIGKMDKTDEEFFMQAHVCLADTKKEYLNNIAIKMISPRFVVTMISGDGQKSYTIVLQQGEIVVNGKLIETGIQKLATGVSSWAPSGTDLLKLFLKVKSML